MIVRSNLTSLVSFCNASSAKSPRYTPNAVKNSEFCMRFYGTLTTDLVKNHRSVTNSSAEVGWIPMVASNWAFVAPAFMATANP